MWEYSSGHLSTTGRRGLAGYSLRKMLRHLSHAKADQPYQRFFDMASGTFDDGCPGSLGFATEVATKTNWRHYGKAPRVQRAKNAGIRKRHVGAITEDTSSSGKLGIR
jgi:hypothetical protein